MTVVTDYLLVLVCSYIYWLLLEHSIFKAVKAMHSGDINIRSMESQN